MWTVCGKNGVSDGWPYDALQQSSNSQSVAAVLSSALYFAGPQITGQAGKKLLFESPGFGVP